MLSCASRFQVGSAGCLRGLVVAGAVVVSLALAGVVRADELHVPGDYGTIQAAIDAAIDGDEVVIADGTYTGDGNRDLDFGGKAITVRSASGDPATCTIDCGGEECGFGFYNDEGPDSIVAGLTITNGTNYYGGGGIYCVSSSPRLVNCRIVGNSSGSYGGGIRCSASSPILEECTISGNWTKESGGGIYCYYGSNATLINCTISGNVAAEYYGGGIACYDDSSASLSNCTISGNSATSWGGGVFCLRSDPTLTNCTITENTSEVGGGVHCSDSSPTLVNCVIVANRAITEGGGVFAYSGASPIVSNCTISGNSAVDGTALGCDSFWHDTPSVVTVSNCILWNGGSEIWNNDGSTVTIEHSDVQGGWVGEGNIDADPLFAFPHDAHLMPGSPCIDVATDEPPGGLTAEDPDGNPRVLDGNGDQVAQVDMGAYEFNQAVPSLALSAQHFEFLAPQDGDSPSDQVLFLRNCGGGTLDWQISGEAAWLTLWPLAGESTGEVDEVTLSVDPSGLTHGSYTATLYVADPQAANSSRVVIVTLHIASTVLVPDEYETIQAALDAAVPGDEVILADGTYTGEGNGDLDFRGKEIAVRSASGDPEACVIDCEGGGRGFYFHLGEGPDAVVDGISIINGNVTWGACVRCRGSSPTIANCRFANSTGSRGAFYCSDGNPTLINCTISGNSGTYTGGIYLLRCSGTVTGCTIRDGSSEQHGAICCAYDNGTVVSDCVITGNEVYYSGGGVSCFEGCPTIVRCTIRGNSAGYGGAVRCYDSDPILVDCVLDGTATYSSTLSGQGGALQCTDSSPLLINCEISGQAPKGGSVYCSSGRAPVLINCMVRGNAVYGGAVYCDGSSPILQGCTVLGDATLEGNTIHCIESSPELVNCIVWTEGPEAVHVESGTPTMQYSDVKAGSGQNWFGIGCIDNNPLLTAAGYLTAVSPCIDSGDPEGDYDEQLDINDEARVLDGRIDIGVDEWLDTDADGLPDWWEMQHFDSATGGEATGNEDGDERVNLDEYRGGTCPHTAPRVLFVDIGGNNAWDGLSPTWRGDKHGPKGTIQAAIDECDPVEGDEVVIANGTYTGDGNRDLDFGGRAIRVRSETGSRGACVIDCQGGYNDPHRGFYFRRGEGAKSVIQGMTVRDGFGSDEWNDGENGGGVFCYLSNPSIIDCAIEDSGAGGSGAFGYGGGIYCWGSRPLIENCRISGNSADGGGGIGGSYSAPAINNCTINGNSAESWPGGAALWFYQSSPIIRGCVIRSNVSSSSGAYGGGISIRECAGALFADCGVYANTSQGYGAGFYLMASSATLMHCTLSRNTSSTAAGLYARDSTATLSSCILWNDGSDEIHMSSADVVAAFSDIQGGTGEPWFGEGCIDVDPQFVDADGADDDPETWEDNDYRLAAGSPCVDTGDPTYIPEPGSVDLDHHLRLWDGDPSGVAIVDMGAYEFGSTVYGDTNCDGYVTFDDITPFVTAIVGQAEYEVQYPGCNWLTADCDFNGAVNFDDIDAFVGLIVGG